MFANQDDFWTSDDSEEELEIEESEVEEDEEKETKEEVVEEEEEEEKKTKDEVEEEEEKKKTKEEEKRGVDAGGESEHKKDSSRKGMIRKKWSVEDESDVSNFREVIGYEPHEGRIGGGGDGDDDDDDVVLRYPYELDDFQKRAIMNIHRGDHVLVAAHTSAGKTAVAEYAIELANKNGRRAIYTSPIKALSSQKYREFLNRFKDYPAHSSFAQRSRIGIVTGDVSINPDAQCVIMTTEILRTMLYRSDPCIEQIQTVIFDEVHYINDPERGVVWEEVLILLDPRVQLVLLSATIPNYIEFANWIGRIKQNTVYCIRTLHRPVPLKHYLYIYEKCFEIMDEHNKFNINGYKDMLDFIKTTKTKKSINSLKNKVNKLNSSISNKNSNNDLSLKSTPTTTLIQDQDQDQDHDLDQTQTQIQDLNISNDNDNDKQDSSFNIIPTNKGIGKGGSILLSSNSETKFKTEVYRLQVFLKLLEKNDQLPVILFGFSRRKVEQLALSLSNLNFIYNHNEKSNIITFIKESTSKLNEIDQKIPQLLQCKELALRGIGIHHSGMLPIIKEMTEILFTRGLIKVLFATETISMGINCPARSIVFTSIQKYDGRKNRILLSCEYTQMSGRAGRRGIDTFGNVFIFNSSHDTIPECIDIVKMMLNTYMPIQSKFRLTYQMILQLSCRHSLTIEDMMTKSFKEMFRAINLPIFQRNLKRKIQKYEEISSHINSIIQSFDSNIAISNFYFQQNHNQHQSILDTINHLINILQNSLSISSQLFNKLSNSNINRNILDQKILNPGKLLLINSFALTGNSFPMFAHLLYHNPNSNLFTILLYSFESSNNLEIHPFINNEHKTIPKSNSNEEFIYNDIVEQSIQDYQNTDKNKQINFIQNLLNLDKSNRTLNKNSSNSKQNSSNNSIQIIHHSNLSSSINNNNNHHPLIKNIKYYYIIENLPFDYFMFIFDLDHLSSLEKSMLKNINFNDKSILHNIAITFSNSLIKQDFSSLNSNSNGKSKNKKSIKVNLFELIHNTQEESPYLTSTFTSSSCNNNKVNTCNNLWPKLLSISKTIKSIEIEYFQLLQNYNDLFLEFINNDIFKDYYSFIINNENQSQHSILHLILELNKLKHEINIYKHFINNESLDDYPEMKLKIQLLIEKGFLDENLTITTKGRIACELLTSDELTLIDILLNGSLHKLNNIHEITSILSCFVFPEKMDPSIINQRPSLPSAPLLTAHDEIIQIHQQYEQLHYKYQINLDTEHFWSLCNDQFMLIAYKWSNHESLKDIMEFIQNSQNNNLHEGTIVRTILRLDELVRKLINSSKLIGDPILEEKLENIHKNISRDIIFMTSLYFN
ncbi:mRNA translation inhibitor SKI2 SFII helicase [Cryptosporidium canis]|uniref:mRNA translation inhibitor SKI2 SFII helicase n=1 Tax=Cryptosporidium canis TaxID=195482 RepID=A0ABQ8P9E3_9CRYT|nr:mRNA translation inhibitor SKI2 SFII helicase [Cryptosporidium canis]